MIIAFIEAIAGSHMHSIAAAHGNLHEVNMPEPDAIYLRGLAYAAFITHQKMSNRGIYSALCPAFPRLLAGIAKMTGIASGQEKPCLASVLRDHGYMTLFTKEEDSECILMREFMLKTGCDTAHGSFHRQQATAAARGRPSSASLVNAVPSVQAA